MFAEKRGFHAGGAHGQFDLNKSSRMILLDYLAGKLLFVELPQDYENKDSINQSNSQFDIEWHQIPQIQELDKEKQKQVKQNQDDFLIDNNTFFDADTQHIIIERLVDMLTDEDVLDLLEGKKVKQIKLDKNLRREVKHIIRRGEVFLLLLLSLSLSLLQDIDIYSILSKDGVSINNIKVNHFQIGGQA